MDGEWCCKMNRVRRTMGTQLRRTEYDLGTECLHQTYTEAKLLWSMDIVKYRKGIRINSIFNWPHRWSQTQQEPWRLKKMGDLLAWRGFIHCPQKIKLIHQARCQNISNMKNKFLRIVIRNMTERDTSPDLFPWNNNKLNIWNSTKTYKLHTNTSECGICA